MPKTLFPGSERISVAFMKGLTGTTAVASTLPENAASWQDSGFLELQVVGGSPDRDVPRAEPVVRVDAWANSGQSTKVPWGKAESLAETARQAISNFPSEQHGRILDMGPDFRDVRVLSVWPISEPRRVEGDPSGYARFTTDFALSWVIV